ncbi:MFS transporter [Methylosinus sp. PW1]|uniref:MFS transporter n=1 Tax=Methylosinus sp. PW1 TaxID=107636 RepID=UPI00068F84D2|nr:MFS transporter [Methylosinus sp. PW1]
MDRTVSIEQSIDNAAIGGRQLIVVGLCGLLAMVDGFDAQAMAYAAPALAAELHIQTSDFGLVFGAGSFGSLTGVLAQGPLGDKFGRKTVMLAAFLLVGAASLLNVQAARLDELIALRFLAGLGLGGALPNLFAITAEYTPRRRRSTFVTAMFCGVPLGSMLGGLIAANILQSHDWRLIFYLGGVAPLLFAAPAWFVVPESAAYLATRPNSRERLRDILRRLNVEPTPQLEATATLAGAEERSTVLHLFGPAYIRGTALLAVIGFLSLLVSISLTNWLPLILSRAGLTIGMAVIGGAVDFH